MRLCSSQRPSAAAVDQLRLLNYSSSVYSRRQVRDLCDECRRHRGEAVTGRGGGVGVGVKVLKMRRRRRRGNMSGVLWQTCKAGDAGAKFWGKKKQIR